MKHLIETQLFSSLLGDKNSLEEALNKASSRIAEIGKRNTSRNFRSVKVHGASVTRLYDYELPNQPVLSTKR